MCLLLLITFLFPQGASADAMLRAQVGVEAEIYAQPDFNARVIEHVRPGTIVLISPDKEVGATGMGVFYKVQTISGKNGYITDSDILAPSLGGLRSLPGSTRSIKKTTDQSSSFGPSIALLDYSERIMGEKKEGEQFFIGVRRTGSPYSFGSLRTEFNLMVSPLPPTFLGDLGAYGAAKGYLVLGDILGIWPILANKSNAANLEFGPMFAYSRYSANLPTGPYDSNQFRPGFTLGLGYAYNFSAGILRLDVKAFAEKTFYFGPITSFQIYL
jgi:hypothetical protein